MTDSSLFGKKDEADSFTLKELLSNIAPGHKDSLRIDILAPINQSRSSLLPTY